MWSPELGPKLGPKLEIDRLSPLGGSDGSDRSWLVVGRILGPFGVQGAVKVRSSMDDSLGIARWDTWWLEGGSFRRTAFRVDWCKAHGRGLIARLEGVVDRDQAARIAGLSVCVPRELLPAPGDGQFYWADLKGVDVFDRAGRRLGRVDHLFETGAQDVLVVVSESGQEILIPFVADFVDGVDVEKKTMVVNPLPGMV